MVGSITIATAAVAGMITLGGRVKSAIGEVSCATGLVKGRDAEEEDNARGATGDVSSEDADGAGAHTSGWMGEKGIHDSESGRFEDRERVSACDVDATAVTTVVAARVNALEIVAVVTSVTRDGNAALGALVTTSSGACTVTTLVTSADTGMEGVLERAVTATVVSRALTSRAGLSQAPSSGSNCSNTCSGGVLSSSSTITGSALDVTSGSAVVRLWRVGVRSPRACDFEICSWRRGDSDDWREGGRANWFKFAFEAELVGFGAIVYGSVLNAKTVEEMAESGLVAARVAGRDTASARVDACFATDTAGGLASSVRRLRGRDLRGLGDFCAGAMVVDDDAETTLVCDAVSVGKKGVVGRGSSDCFGAAPALKGCLA